MIPTANRLSSVQEYYFSSKLPEVRKLASGGREVFNLGIGSPDLPPSDQTIETLRETALEKGSHGYQPYRGIPELRKAMAGWYQRIFGVSLNSQWEILPLMGSKEGIFHISMAFLNPGDQALVPDPGYPGYVSAINLVGAEAVYYNLSSNNGWLPDLASLNNADLSKVKLMWINYPHMPTGAIASEQYFRNLLEFARANGILLCHDNPYSLILNPEKPLSILAQKGGFDHALELNSLSKSHHLAGWRVGMLAGSRSYLDAVLKVKSNLDSGMFRSVQLAAAEALNNSTEWHKAQNSRYQQRREAVFQLLDLLGFTYSQKTAGMFVWAKAPDEIIDVEAFLDDLLYKCGIFICPGKVFGKNGERYARVSICSPKETIFRAIEVIKALLSGKVADQVHQIKKVSCKNQTIQPRIRANDHESTTTTRGGGLYIPLEEVTLKGFYFTWLRHALSGPPPLAAVFKTLIKKFCIKNYPFNSGVRDASSLGKENEQYERYIR